MKGMLIALCTVFGGLIILVLCYNLCNPIPDNLTPRRAYKNVPNETAKQLMDGLMKEHYASYSAREVSRSGVKVLSITLTMTLISFVLKNELSGWKVFALAFVMNACFYGFDITLLDLNNRQLTYLGDMRNYRLDLDSVSQSLRDSIVVFALNGTENFRYSSYLSNGKGDVSLSPPNSDKSNASLRRKVRLAIGNWRMNDVMWYLAPVILCGVALLFPKPKQETTNTHFHFP